MMFLLKKSFFLLLIVFYFVCCKKKGDSHTFISGQVFEAGTNRILVGSTIILGSASNNNLSGYGFRTVAYQITGSTGKFSFDFYASSDSIYVVGVQKSLYFNSNYYYLINEKANEHNFYLYPNAYVKFHLRGVLPNEKISLGYPCSLSCDFYANYLIDTVTPYYVFQGNYNQSLKWWVSKLDTVNGIWLPPTIHDSIIRTNGFDSLTVNINY